MLALLLSLALTVATNVNHVAPTPPTPATPPAPRAPRLPRMRLEDLAELGHVQTDTTFAVTTGARFELSNFGGEITVHGWDKSLIHLAVEHSDRSRVEVVNNGPVWTVKAYSKMGVPRALQYDLTVPSWLPMALSGVYTDVTVEGVKANLNVDTVKGDVTVNGGLGDIRLTTVEGDMCLRNAKGRIALSAVNNDIRVEDATGPLTVETVNGDIRLIKVVSDSVEATSLNGEIAFDSPIHDGGSYHFATHQGDIVVSMPENPSARIEVATFSGSFESTFPVRLNELKQGKHFNFVLGGGKALLDLESFQGTIQLCRASEGCAHADDSGCAPTGGEQVQVKALRDLGERIKAVQKAQEKLKEKEKEKKKHKDSDDEEDN